MNEKGQWFGWGDNRYSRISGMSANHRNSSSHSPSFIDQPIKLNIDFKKVIDIFVGVNRSFVILNECIPISSE